MQLAAPASNARIGTCPHGLSPGACPICSGMGGGGGGMKKADFSAKPGEMSWNECAAIGAFLKAQQNSKMQREQDALNFAKTAQIFQTIMLNAGQKIANLAQIISNTMPPIISKPANFILNTIVGGTLNLIRNIPTAITNVVQTISQKIADISDKLAAVMGELKAAIEEKISKTFSDLKKKVKSLFAIFKPLNSDNNDKQVDETKRTFELKTFIHDLYRKLINEKDENDDENPST